jgi:hypothetical protein
MARKPSSNRLPCSMSPVALARPILSLHVSNDYVLRPDLIAERVEQLHAAAPASLGIHTGRDFHLSFDNLEELRENPRRYTINGGRYLLVEFPNLFHSALDVG